VSTEDAYQRLADAIDAVARIEGADGILTEWVVVTATQRYDEDGVALTQVCTLLPHGGQVPHHRLMGLLDYALTLTRAAITEPE